MLFQGSEVCMLMWRLFRWAAPEIMNRFPLFCRRNPDASPVGKLKYLLLYEMLWLYSLARIIPPPRFTHLKLTSQRTSMFLTVWIAVNFNKPGFGRKINTFLGRDRFFPPHFYERSFCSIQAKRSPPAAWCFSWQADLDAAHLRLQALSCHRASFLRKKRKEKLDGR